MRLAPFRPAHFRALAIQPHQQAYADQLTGADWLSLEGWSVLVGEEPIACGGVLDIGEGRGEAWSVLSEAAGRRMTALTRMVRRGLDLDPRRYIQAHVSADFAPAARWVRLCGFTRIGRLPAYCGDGSDGELWVRVRK